MTLPVQKPLVSLQEYFRREEKALDKHEFHEGEILAMSGNNYEHSLIAANLIREVGNRLKGSRCRPLDSNMRISVVPGSRYVYPDVTVVCGDPQFDPMDFRPRSLLNPKVIIEILSESTEAYDRGEKFAKYRQMNSLEEYVLVSQFSPQIETFTRREDGTWLFSSWSGPEAVVKLHTLRIELPLSEVYSEVTFPERPEVIDQPPTQDEIH
jgi:Uma2 family endonuclease